MYSFRSGLMYHNNFKSAAVLKAGTPVTVSSDGELSATANGEVPDGILTTDVKVGEYAGFQSDGFCATSMIGSATAIEIGDPLVVSDGKLVKHAGSGAIVAKAFSAVTGDQSSKTKEDAYPDGMRLPEIQIIKAAGSVLS